MKAIVYRRNGPPDVLEVAEVAKPVPGDGDVLVRVRAAALNPLDYRLMRAEPGVLRLFFGVSDQRVGRPGRDAAGVVEAVGGNVTRLSPGDAVFGTCRGAFAEYTCAAESAWAGKPAGVAFEQAAAVPVAGLTALQGLRDSGRLQPGQRVLINGAAGGVGTFAVQIAKALGAEVTGVCSTRNVAMVRGIGADHVVDYAREDFTVSGRRYDLLVDCVGNHPLSACRRVLERKGTYVAVGAPGTKALTRALATVATSPFVSQRMTPVVAKGNQRDLTLLAEMMASGKVTPVIDRRYPLREASAAFRYLEQGHARGKVVLDVEDGTAAGRNA